MAWDVEFQSQFVPEFKAVSEDVQDELLADVEVLEECGGDKSGGSQTRFYRRLIARADERFDAHLAALRRAETATSGSRNRKRRS